MLHQLAKQRLSNHYIELLQQFKLKTQLLISLKNVFMFKLKQKCVRYNSYP